MWLAMRPVLLGAASICGLLALWWAATSGGWISPIILPSPAGVIAGFKDINGGYLGGTLLSQLGASLSVVMTGYVAAVLIGVSLGILMAWSSTVDTMFASVISVLRPIPPPAWIPLAILWFGIGLGGKVFIVAISAFVPCLVNSYVAIKETPVDLLNAAKVLGASNRTLLLHVAIPSATPTLLAGLRIALGNAWASVVAAELVVATAGFGYVIMSGYRNLEPRLIAVGIISVAITGAALNILFRIVERRLLRWNASHG